MTNEEIINTLNSLKQYYNDKNEDSYVGFDNEDNEALDMAINSLEQQPKTGHWINHREHCENLGVKPSGLGAYEWCSNCDCGIDVKEFHRIHYNLCPVCGADMQETESEE